MSEYFDDNAALEDEVPEEVLRVAKNVFGFRKTLNDIHGLDEVEEDPSIEDQTE